jgi:photosystem II stability/assembly factor-like uncharacterized protein
MAAGSRAGDNGGVTSASEQERATRFRRLAVIAGLIALGIALAGGLLVAARRDSGRQGATAAASATSVAGDLVVQPALVTLAMADSTAGWALSAASTGNFMVVRTADGGRTWRDVSPLPGQTCDINAAFFLDSDHAWALVVRPGPDGEPQDRVFWTQDAARTWREGPVLGGAFAFGQITFADAQFGWFAQDREGAEGMQSIALFRTADSGLTWRQMTATIADDRASETQRLPESCRKDFLMLDRARGFATGSCQGGLPFVFRTEDGGATWRRQVLLVPGESGQVGDCRCGISGPTFPTANDGFLAVSGDLRVVYATHDGGATWQQAGWPVDAGPSGIEFADALHGWLRDGRSLYGTNDGGMTWTLRSQILDGGPLSFSSTTDGWAWLRHGWKQQGPSVLAHSTDGGRTWAPVNP